MSVVFLYLNFTYDECMNISKRLTQAQIKRQALLEAGIQPKSYGKKKASQVMRSKKKQLASRKQKHKNLEQ
ncbi:MAG: hypothetical protein EBS31_06540 [Burkholderiaceae bacterium]|jgi:hypothetical protein|nr:hypothetical protein [Burkholderiaceae bacterium]